MFFLSPLSTMKEKPMSDAKLDEYSKALESLRKAVEATKSDLNRDATIQRFEFCVELAWKSARRVMGTATSAPKAVIREMARNGLIEDAEFWLQAIEQRNLSSHTYKEELAEEVYAFAARFLPQALELLERLRVS
jgi:nucleotidyltransferase substrate binding protein (TIGR01987 family)